MDINSTKEFKALLHKKGYRYKDGSQGWIRITCPTCSPDDASKMKRYVHPAYFSSHCFICEQHVPIADLLGDVHFKGSCDVDVKEYEHPQAKEFPFNSAIPINQLEKDHPAIKFLEADHFSDFDELYDKFWVYFIPKGCEKEIKFDTGAIIKPFDALCFPVWINHALEGWQCRFVPGTPNGDKYKKMKYFHIFNKGKCLYNYDTASKSPFVVIFEGIKKTWKYPSAGVSTLGKGITSAQIQMLQNNWKKLVFFLDGEPEAQRVALQTCDIIRTNSGPECININPADYGFKSPDEMTHEQVKNVIEEKLG